MRKILSGRRGSGKGKFEMKVNSAIQTQYGFTTPSGTGQFYFPISNGTDDLGYTINFTINWGDGTTSNVNSSNYATECLHTFTGGPGTYTISAEGNIAGFCFWNILGMHLLLICLLEWCIVCRIAFNCPALFGRGGDDGCPRQLIVR